MDIQPRIKTLTSKKLVGFKLTMSLAENKTSQLWKSFMTRRNEIASPLNSNLFSMQIYTTPLGLGNLTQEFEKWATIEVSNFEKVPKGMETFNLKSGLYAVFNYKGLSTDHRIFIYIFSTWLPNSEYELDNRPHFEILGEKYKNNDINSEEEIWIPIKPK